MDIFKLIGNENVLFYLYDSPDSMRMPMGIFYKKIWKQ